MLPCCAKVPRLTGAESGLEILWLNAVIFCGSLWSQPKESRELGATTGPWKKLYSLIEWLCVAHLLSQCGPLSLADKWRSSSETSCKAGSLQNASCCSPCNGKCAQEARCRPARPLQNKNTNRGVLLWNQPSKISAGLPVMMNVGRGRTCKCPQRWRLCCPKTWFFFFFWFGPHHWSKVS